MLELENDKLTFSFPEVHPQAKLTLEFQRTLRIPDDNKTYPLPPGLGRFPVRHVDDFARRVPAEWVEHGGVMLPMYQSEALWIRFAVDYVNRQGSYPFAIKIAAGKINAVTGKPWTTGLHRDPQDYVVSPWQPWLDGFCVSAGVIRQFVAMPLGSGYSAEEQRTGRAEHGGLQVMAFPMKRDVFERRFPNQREQSFAFFSGAKDGELPLFDSAAPAGMGLAPGGKMRQEIYKDPYHLSDWDTQSSRRCFVHLCNSMTWRQITQSEPPHPPLTATEYTQAGYPWFDYYDDRSKVLAGSSELAGLKSLAEMAKEKGDVLDSPPLDIDQIIQLRKQRPYAEVREGRF